MKALLWMNWKRGGDVVNPMGGKMQYVGATLVVGSCGDPRLEQGIWLSDEEMA